MPTLPITRTNPFQRLLPLKYIHSPFNKRANKTPYESERGGHRDPDLLYFVINASFFYYILHFTQIQDDTDRDFFM